MKKLLIITLSLFLLSSCSLFKPRYITLTKTDSVYVHSIKYDSIYIHEKDSSSVTQKGDTLYIEKWNTKWAFKYKLKTDTLTKIKNVPYPVPVEKIVEVEKKLNWFQQLFIGLGKLAAIAGILWLAIVLFKGYLKQDD